MSTPHPSPSQAPRLGLSRRAVLLISGGFGLGLLLFLLLWLDMRDNGNFYRATDKPEALSLIHI